MMHKFSEEDYGRWCAQSSLSFPFAEFLSGSSRVRVGKSVLLFHGWIFQVQVNLLVSTKDDEERLGEEVRIL